MASTGGGPVAALRRLLATLLTSGQTRLALLANELQIAKFRTLRQLAQVLVAVFCLCMALLLGVGLVLVLWWDQRVAVLAGLLVLFLAVAAVLLWSLKQAAATEDMPFAASLAELQEDLRRLKAASTSHGPQQEPR